MGFSRRMKRAAQHAQDPAYAQVQEIFKDVEAAPDDAWLVLVVQHTDSGNQISSRLPVNTIKNISYLAETVTAASKYLVSELFDKGIIERGGSERFLMMAITTMHAIIANEDIQKEWDSMPGDIGWVDSEGFIEPVGEFN